MREIFNQIAAFCVSALPLFLAIVLHEIAHGYAALMCGDATAKRAKRLSLNPLRHVDPVGTVIFPALLILTRAPFMFGWAKPVPVNFAALKKPKRDMALVALAGPAMNFVLALISSGVLAFCFKRHAFVPSGEFERFFMVFLLSNLSLMLFNLIPVLPLDGGRVLTGLLPLKAARAFAKTERYGFPALIFLLGVLPVVSGKFGRDWDVVGMYLAGGVRFILEWLDKLYGLV